MKARFYKPFKGCYFGILPRKQSEVTYIRLVSVRKPLRAESLSKWPVSGLYVASTVLLPVRQCLSLPARATPRRSNRGFTKLTFLYAVITELQVIP